jgi:L-glutamine-phosphate cytidylyltransferase
MKAIILAAGTGTRLFPYTKDRPKCLVEVNGITLLDRQLAILSAAGIHEVIVIGGYCADALEERVPVLRRNPLYSDTNMVSTLFCAESDLIGTCIVSYGDIVYSRKILSELLKADDDISVTIDMNWKPYWYARSENPIEDAETLKINKDGLIGEIGQKPNTLEEIEGQYMGLMKFSEKGTEALKDAYHESCKKGDIRGKKIEKAYMTDLLQLMIDSGHKVKAVPVSDYWVEIDTIEDLENPVTKDRVARIDNE